MQETKKQTVYLDNSSTTAALKSVRRAMCQAMRDNYANPSSLHRLGMEAERMIEAGRRAAAGLLEAEPEEIYFTSGATEANNIIIRGAAQAYAQRGSHIITSQIEHPSVRLTCRDLQDRGFSVSYLPADERGRVRVDRLREALREDTILCSIMTVNNEVGSIQPLSEIGRELDKKPGPRPLFHTDAVQGVGKVDLPLKEAGIDAMSLSAHKFHGPKGIGVMYLRRGLSVPPLQTGGGQERGLRSGTENTEAIAGMTEAIEWLMQNEEDNRDYLRHLRRRLAELIQQAVPQAVINGAPPGRKHQDVQAPHILNVSVEGIRGEVMVHALEQRGVFASTGAACSTNKRIHSTTLASMPLPQGRIDSAVRLSMSPMNTVDEMKTAAQALKSAAQQLMKG